MSIFTKELKEMRSYLLLWFTQMISGLGIPVCCPLVDGNWRVSVVPR